VRVVFLVALLTVLPAQQPKVKATLNAGGIVNWIAVSPGGKFLASGTSRGEVILWDPQTGKRLRSWGGPAHIASLAFSPNGKLLACGHFKYRTPSLFDWTVEVREVGSGERRASFTGSARNTNPELAFSPDGRTLAVATGDSIELREAATWRERGVILGRGAKVGRLRFSPDGRTVSVGTVDDAVCLWGVVSGRELVRLKGHTAYVPAGDFSPDGKLLATAGLDKTVRVWDLRTGRQKAVLNGHTGGVYSVTFALGGRFVASGSDDGTTRLWDVVAGKQVWLHRGAEAGRLRGDKVWVASSGDGKILASAELGSGVIKVWDLSPLKKK
jgi:WD40 repeat protein